MNTKFIGRFTKSVLILGLIASLSEATPCQASNLRHLFRHLKPRITIDGIPMPRHNISRECWGGMSREQAQEINERCNKLMIDYMPILLVEINTASSTLQETNTVPVIK
jgi:hypothetical protein